MIEKTEPGYVRPRWPQENPQARLARKARIGALERSTARLLHSMEPMRISEECDREASSMDLVLDLTKRSASLQGQPPEGLGGAACGLRPIDELLLQQPYRGPQHSSRRYRACSQERHQRRTQRSVDLQLEAKAHIAVQRWIDEGGLHGQEKDRRGSTSKSIAASPTTCRKIFSGSRIPSTGEKMPSFLGDRENAMPRSEIMCHQPGRIASIHASGLKNAYAGLGTFETDHCPRRRAPPPALHPSICRWEWSRHKAHVLRHDAAHARHRWTMVDRAWPRPPPGRVQGYLG